MLGLPSPKFPISSALPKMPKVEAAMETPQGAFSGPLLIPECQVAHAVSIEAANETVADTILGFTIGADFGIHNI